MISVKSSTNPESFIRFGRGRRIDLATSHGNTLIMNMNKSPDETLKQGRNRSWLLVKFSLLVVFMVYDEWKLLDG